ncbi:hypothetical protein K239x_08440 [Planctomycetes bacterium K23_9]|uniref:Uncharacterized protein n=1 Tax=Stieleria marina TaxID=1930275 RepID=A0A517NP48_9BACT|nr:hypothetical protein K239x_08440 [Planctomycetes bacterium K23_9]
MALDSTLLTPGAEGCENAAKRQFGIESVRQKRVKLVTIVKPQNGLPVADG